MQAENDLVTDTLNTYALHTTLQVPKRIHVPRVPPSDDGRKCEMCGAGFPASEIQTAPCGHYYHLFCLAIRVAIIPDCCRTVCREPFPPCWLQAYGFPSYVQSESESESSDGSSSDDESSGESDYLGCYFLPL